jgi:hypothetical protein
VRFTNRATTITARKEANAKTTNGPRRPKLGLAAVVFEREVAVFGAVQMEMEDIGLEHLDVSHELFDPGCTAVAKLEGAVLPLESIPNHVEVLARAGASLVRGLGVHQQEPGATFKPRSVRHRVGESAPIAGAGDEDGKVEAPADRRHETMANPKSDPGGSSEEDHQAIRVRGLRPNPVESLFDM